MEIKQPKEYLTVEEVQNILGIGRNQAYNLCKSGKFNVVRSGRRIIVSAKSFYRWFHGGDADD